MKAALVVFSAIFTMVMMSIIFDLTPTGADKAFLALMGTSFVSAIIGSMLFSIFNETNGNDTGLVIFALMLIGDVVVCMIAPLLILFGVTPFETTALVGVGLIALWNILLNAGLL